MPQKTLGEIAVQSIAFAAAVLIMRKYGSINIFGKSKEKKRIEKESLLTEMESFASKEVISFISEVYNETLGKELRELNRKLSSEIITFKEYDTKLALLLERHYNNR